MKHFFANLFFLSVCVSMLISCGSNSSSSEDRTQQLIAVGNANDSLAKVIMESHDKGMEIFKQLEVARSNVNAEIDSLTVHAVLDENSKEAKYKEKLDSLSNNLSASLSAMSDWMNNLKMDSAMYDVTQRNSYLKEQAHVMDSINMQMKESLNLSDSLLKK